MFFLITLIENMPNLVFVQNKSDRDYVYRKLVKIEVGQEISIKTGLAKELFGDWEKEGIYGEMQRRKMKGISEFKLEIQTKTHENETIDTDEGETIEVNYKEEEFADLNKENEEKEEEKDNQCQAPTKSGKRCKRVAEEGSEFCPIHRKGE